MALKIGARGALRGLGKALHVLLRGLAWAFLAAVLAAAGLGVYVYRNFRPEQVRAMAVEQLSGLLRREVLIDRVVLTPRGVKVLGLRVRRGGADPGLPENVLSCDSALVTIRLRPLLERRVDVDSILLEAPQISLLRDAQGDWELADVLGSTRPAGAAAFPVDVAGAQLAVADGRLSVDDRLGGRRVSLERFSLSTPGIDLSRPFPLESSFSSELQIGARTIATRVSAQLLLDLARLEWSSATLRVERADLEAGGASFRAAGWIEGFATPRFDAELSAPALGPDFWQAIAGRPLPLRLPPAKWKLKASLPAPGMLDLEKATVDTPAGRLNAQGVFDLGASTPTMSLEVSAKDAALERMAGWHPALERHALKGRASGRVSLQGWSARLRPVEGELSVRGFGGSWSERQLDGVDGELSFADEAARVKIGVSKGKARVAGHWFDDAVLSLAYQKGSLSIERLNFRWGSSQAKLRARIERLPTPKEVVLSGSVDKLDWNATAKLVADVRAMLSTRTAASGAPAPESRWLRAFKDAIPKVVPDSVGRVRVGEVAHPNFWCRDVELLWSLRGVTPALDRFAGEARLSFGPGRVSDIPAVQDANKFLRIVFLPFIFMHKMNNLSVFSTGTAYPKTLDFAKIDGEYGATRGVASIRFFHVDSPQLAAYAEGAADLGREKVDMDILTRLSQYRGALPEWWVDEVGRPAIGFRVKGDINRPDLEPRFKKIGADELEKRVRDARERAKKRFEAQEKLQALQH